MASWKFLTQTLRSLREEVWKAANQSINQSTTSFANSTVTQVN